jgi:hypothetical protein
VTISYGPLAQAASLTGDADADHLLFQGYLHDSNSPVSIVISNVPPTTNYSLLVYSVGVNDGATYEESIGLTGQQAYPTFHVRAQDASLYGAAPDYVRMASIDPGARDVGNYVQFDNVRPAVDGTLLLTVTPESGNVGSGFLPPLNALQLVAVQPVPQTASYDGTTHTVNIAWTSAAAGYTLRSTPSLASGAIWTPVAGVPDPITAAGSISITVGPAGATFVQLSGATSIQVYIQEPDRIIPLGTTNVMFTAVPSLPEPLTYQWTINGTKIPYGTNRVLTIDHPMDLTDVGGYIVSVESAISTNLPGASSSPKFLSASTNDFTGSWNLTIAIGSFSSTTTSGCPPSGIDKLWNLNPPFGGPNYSGSSSYPNPGGYTKFQADTCNNPPSNDTALKLFQNNPPPLYPNGPTVIACNDDASPACSANALKLSRFGPVNLPTGTAAATGSCRLVTYLKSSTLASGQTAVNLHFAYSP